MRVEYGQNEVDRLGTFLHELGSKRVLIVCSPSRRHVERLESALGGMVTSICAEARVHVPLEAVDAALEALDAHDADTVVAIGGGAAVGLGKALCLQRDVALVAVPTTYSGSERTNIYGIRKDGVKQTGRDDRVRPKVVVYDPTLTLAMPLELTLQSLANSFAQVVSAASTGSVEIDDQMAAVLSDLWISMQSLPASPTSIERRERALIAASRAGKAIDEGSMGAQHAMAHAVGGSFDLEHGAVHSVLLPIFMSHLRRENRELLVRIDEACGASEIEALIYDALRDSKCPVSLRELELGRSDMQSLIEQLPALPADMLWDAYYGIRPSMDAHVVREEGEPRCLTVGTPREADTVVLAVHGRGANAGRMLRDVRNALGTPSNVCYVIPQAVDCAWYSKSYASPLREHGEELEEALRRIESLVDELARDVQPANILLFGFSQGACLSLEYLARRGGRLRGLVAAAGARIGETNEIAAPTNVSGTPVLIGAAVNDPWLREQDVRTAERGFQTAGANVKTFLVPGDQHAIHSVLAEAARALL